MMSNFFDRLRDWINHRLERRITAYSVAVILSISSIFGAVSLATSFWLVRRYQHIDLEHRLDRLVGRLNDKVDVFIRNIHGLSRNPLVLNGLLDSKGRNIYLLPFFTHYQIPLIEPHRLALCDFEGKLLIQQKLHPVGCLAELPQSRAVIATEQPQALIAIIEQKPYLAIFQPVFYPATGRAEGYIFAALDLQALVAEKNATGPDATLTLRSADGRLHFAAKDGSAVSPNLTSGQLTHLLFTAGPFTSAGLTLALHEPTDFFTSVVPLLAGYSLATLALLALTLVLSRQLAHRLAEPLLILNHTAHRITVEGPTAGLANIHRTDEIGELADSFNHMITSLRQALEGLEIKVAARTQELQQALLKVEQHDQFSHAILNSMDSYIAVLDRNGVILAVNEPWRCFGLVNGIEPGNAIWHPIVGVNYLEVCQNAIGEWSEEAKVAYDGIQAVLAGQQSHFSLEYPCHAPHQQRWFTVRVTRLGAGRQGAVIAHTDITKLKVAEAALQESEARHRLALTALADGVMVYNRQGQIIAANPAAERILGVSVDELRRLAVDDGRWQTIQPDRTPFPRENYPAMITLRDGVPQRDVLMGILQPHGETTWIRINTEPMPELDSGALCAAVVSFSDVTARKMAEDALRESESRFRALVDLLPYGVQENDLTGRITFANPALECLHGQWEGGVVGRFIWDFMANDAEREALRDYLQFLICEQPPPTPYFTKDCCADGSIIDAQVDWNYRRDQRDQLQSFISVITDVTERRRMQEALREQAVRDALTGLFNRRYLDETLPREISRCLRNNEPLAVAMLDLDHFKHFNDTYGHEVGDVVLRSVGDLLNRSVRAEDIACRYGGEELTVILPGSSAEDARARLDCLRQAIMHLHLNYRDSELPIITVSIGIAVTGAETTDATALLKQSDQALYRAKEKGRNRVVVASNQDVFT